VQALTLSEEALRLVAPAVAESGLDGGAGGVVL